MVDTSPVSYPVSPLRRLALWLVRPLTDTHFVLVLLLAIPALLPLTAPGYFFTAHDGHHSVFWLVEFDKTFRDGRLWPVWAPDHVLGFGYPLWLLYAPFSYYVAEAFHLLGLGFTAAVKLAWALWFLIGATGMYRLARRWWGSGAGLVAALAYTYAPYHLADIYVRAAFAEFAALAIAPWALLALVNVWEKPGARNAALAALALGVLLLTHSMAPAVLFPLLIGFVAWKVLEAGGVWVRGRWTTPAPTGRCGVDGGRRTAYTGIVHRLSSTVWVSVALALGIGLALIFWLPALVERRYLQEASWLQGTYEYALHFVYPNQFLSTFWGYGFSVPGPDDGMSFQLGVIQWIGAAVAGLAVSGVLRPALRQRRSEALFLVVASVIVIFAMTPAAAPLWAAFPLSASIQFPWRLLSITTITLALLVGAAAHWLERETTAGDHAGPYLYGVALLLVFASFAYARPQLSPIRPQDENALAIVEFEATYPDMRGMTGFATRPPSEAESPLIAEYLAGEPLRRAAVVTGSGAVIDQGNTADSAWARVRADSAIGLRFYTNYFPGWQATVDGQPANIAPDPPDGLIGLDVPPGEHEVRLAFGPTSVRRIGTILSLAAAAGVMALLVLGGRHRTNPGSSRG